MKERKDIRPTISITMKGFIIKDALINSGIRIGLSSKLIVREIGNSICQKSFTKVDMIDGGLVARFGVIEDIVI